MPFSLNQAVVLTGGRGTRLLPLTEHLPKPMVEVCGLPFLEHIVVQLKQQGIQKVLFLTGHLHEKIESYFQDGSRWNMDITYSHGDAEWETGRRLFRAKHLLEDHFFLLYGDNFYNYNLSKLKDFYLQHKLLLSLIVIPKKTGNIRLNPEGKIDLYDSTRKSFGLTHVELGFMIVNKIVVDLIADEKNPSFSRTLELLVSKKEIIGYKAYDIYHSISDPERLRLTENYLRTKKIILIDRDGTINEKAPRGTYITSLEKLTILPESLKALKKLSEKGFSFIVITNQAGLSTGDITPLQLEVIHQKMKDELSKEGICIKDIYISDAHWQDNENWYRKPNPGLFFKLSEEHQIYLSNTFYVGDDPRDMEAAINCDTRGIYLGKLSELNEEIKSQVVFSSLSMIEIADFILKDFPE